MALYRPSWKAPDGKREKSPFWHYDFTYHGKRYKGSTEETNKVNARTVETNKRNEAKTGGLDREIKPIGFSAFADEYLNLHGNGKRSADFYDFTVRVLKGYFGERALVSITPKDCAEFMAERRKKVKPSTANASLTVLKHMLKMAEEWGYLYEGTNPARKLKRDKVRNQRDRYATVEETGKLLDACNDWIRPVVLTALHTGGRRGEILGLTWADVDFDRNVIRFGDTKNGDARKVPISESLAACLRGLGSRAKHGPVFLRGSEPVTKKLLRSGYAAACTSADITGLRFHDLRHTWATYMADDVPIRTLQELGGWKRLDQVMRYAAVSRASKQKAAEAINRLYVLPPQDPHKQQGQEEAGSCA
jgi:integrase